MSLPGLSFCFCAEHTNTNASGLFLSLTLSKKRDGWKRYIYIMRVCRTTTECARAFVFVRAFYSLVFSCEKFRIFFPNTSTRFLETLNFKKARKKQNAALPHIIKERKKACTRTHRAGEPSTTHTHRERERERFTAFRCIFPFFTKSNTHKKKSFSTFFLSKSNRKKENNKYIS